jgi:hypothetical protein
MPEIQIVRNPSSVKFLLANPGSPIPVAARSNAWVCGLLGLRVRIPPGIGKSVSFECCVLSGRGLCVRTILQPEESYRKYCVLPYKIW